MSDEKDQEKDTPSEPSTEKTAEESVTEDVKKTEAEPTIPKSRLDKEIAKRKELEAKLDSVVKQVTPQGEIVAEPKGPNVEDRLAAVEFMAKHKEFDAEDYEAAHAIAKGRTVSLEDAIKDPLFESFQEKKAEKKATEEATPTTERSPKFAPEKPVKEMSEEEHRAHFNKVVNG